MLLVNINCDSPKITKLNKNEMKLEKQNYKNKPKLNIP